MRNSNKIDVILKHSLNFAAFQIAGQSDESVMVLIMLARNAVTEKRFRDASYFYWLLSQISLNLNKTVDELQTMFLQYYEKAEIYYAYHEVHKYVVSNLCITLQYINNCN